MKKKKEKTKNEKILPVVQKVMVKQMIECNPPLIIQNYLNLWSPKMTARGGYSWQVLMENHPNILSVQERRLYAELRLWGLLLCCVETDVLLVFLIDFGMLWKREIQQCVAYCLLLITDRCLMKHAKLEYSLQFSVVGRSSEYTEGIHSHVASWCWVSAPPAFHRLTRYRRYLLPTAVPASAFDRG